MLKFEYQYADNALFTIFKSFAARLCAFNNNLYLICFRNPLYEYYLTDKTINNKERILHISETALS